MLWALTKAIDEVFAEGSAIGQISKLEAALAMSRQK